MATTTKAARHHHVLAAVKTANDSADEYRQGLWTIVMYSGQVKAYQIPNLKDPTQWPGGAEAYQQTQTTWADVTGTLRAWSLSTLQNVLEIPEQLINNSTQVIVPTLQAGILLCNGLIQDPNNTIAKNDLMGELNLLSVNFSQYSAQIAALISSLQSQASVFDNDARTMSSIAAQALQAAGNERQQVETFNQAISDLNRDIKAAAVTIAGGSLAAVTGIAIGIVGLALVPATEGVSLVLLVPAFLITAGGAVAITLAAKKIVDDKNAISQLNAQIGRMQADIVLVNALSTTMTGFAEQVDALRNSLNAILTPWEAAQTYLASTISELTGIEHATAENWQQVKTELSEILTGWNTLDQTMQKLKADAEVAPNSNLQLGDSASDVRQKMNSATKVKLIQYLRAA
jgi:ABC-type transporter Mla subunit MlaD